jgi:glycosyl transferase family 4
LRILITNIRFAVRSGTEIVVRDFALRLSERGHDVSVYSPSIGELAEELTSRGIAVVDDLLKIAHAPDIIHGHHLPSTAEAILAFPQTPAIWICHASTSWFDAPPPFSQVRRIFAVDDTCRARLIDSEHVPAERVDLLPNAVDLRRVPARSTPLPAKPARALSLVKHSGPEVLIAEACRQTGLSFEAYGHGVGRVVDDIERRCAQADIVFATARTALEAMASGAAVILIDGRGFGGLATTANYAQGRRLNFGVGQLQQQATLSGLIDAIGAYDADDAALVSGRVRHDADLDLTISRLENIYRSFVEETAGGNPFDPDTLRREQIAFLRSWIMKLEPAGPWLDEQTYLLAQHTEFRQQLAAQTTELTELQVRYAAQAAALAEQQDRHTAQIRELIRLHDQHAVQTRQLTELQTQIVQKDSMIQTLASQIERSERSRAVRIAKFLRRSLGLTRH